jgi:pectate lyase
MKFTPVILFTAAAVSSPLHRIDVREVTKRQAAEACPIGYCLENGGTSGGSEGETVTVSDLAGLTEAAESEGPLTIIVNGSISGSAKIRVASNKTIFGENGACKPLKLLVIVKRI